MPNDTTTAPAPEDVRVGATIRALRELHELSAAGLGRAIGKSEALITAIERGDRHATVAVCRDVAKVFSLPLAAITVEGWEPDKAAS